MSSDLSAKTRRQKAFAVLPTLLTLGNAVCGFGAITLLARVAPDFELHDPQLQVYRAAQLLFLAMLFDALDGSAARLTNQTSEFGAMLDSLCDVVSFGVAPAFMMLKLTDPRHHLMDTLDGSSVPAADAAAPIVEASASLGLHAPFDYSIDFLWAIAALFLACAILRLARFNVETDEEDSHEGFSGLPSPAAAAVIASIPIGVMAIQKRMDGPAAVSWGKPLGEVVLPTLAVLLPFITLAVAILMVSRVPYPHIFTQILKGDRGRMQLLQLVFTVALLFVVGGVAVPLLVCWFAFAAPTKALWKRARSPRAADEVST